jgi:DinB superfamily
VLAASNPKPPRHPQRRPKPEDATVKELSTRLLTLIDAAGPVLAQVSDQQSIEPIQTGGWSRKQLVGHLIDSASNNHQRFVRASLQSALNFPGYDQNGNVRSQQFQVVSWPLLVSLWHSYNQFLAHVIAHLPASQLKTTCRIGAEPPVTLEFLANDYVDHLEHHLLQMGVEANQTVPA